MDAKCLERANPSHLVSIGISAGQESLHKRTVGHQANVVLPALRENLVFDGSPKQAVGELVDLDVADFQQV